MEKFKKVLKVIAGIIIAPIFIFCFMLDRAILVFLPWLETKTMMGWFRNNDQILASCIRVTFVLIVYWLYRLIF